MHRNTYENIGMLFGVPTFFLSYIYCIASYGFLLGLGLGWLPSLIVAFTAMWLWPAVVLLTALAVSVL